MLHMVRVCDHKETRKNLYMRLNYMHNSTAIIQLGSTVGMSEWTHGLVDHGGVFDYVTLWSL